jgi:hypothetical protein
MRKRSVQGGSGFLSVFSSFVSFFSLVSVGCCGTWLYVLSFLPGVIGTGTSVFLIKNSAELAATGLVLMALSTTYTYLSVAKSVKHRG